MAKMKGINLAAAAARFDGEFKKQRKSLGSDVMARRNFIAPGVALAWFWLVSICAVIWAIIVTIMIINDGGRNVPVFMAVGPIVASVLIVLIARVIYECIVILFAIEQNTRQGRDFGEMNMKAQSEGCDTLADIRDALLRIEEKMDSRGETTASADDGIVVECPHCGSTIRLPNDIQNGQNARCSSCGNKFQYAG